MNLTEKAEQVVLKLLEATRAEQMKWSRQFDTTFIHLLSDVRVEFAFTGELLDKFFTVYKTKVQNSYDGDTYFWTEQNCVALLDEHKKFLWELPKTRFTDDLFELVFLKACKIEETLDDILNGWI